MTIQLPPEHLLDTDMVMQRAAQTYQICLRSFEQFRDIIAAMAKDDRDYARTGLSVTSHDSCPAFSVQLAGRSVRFSFSLRITDDANNGLIAVHMMPLHDGLEQPHFLGSFTFDIAGRSAEVTAKGPLNITVGQVAMAIVLHYFQQAWQIGFAHPQSPLPR